MTKDKRKPAPAATETGCGVGAVTLPSASQAPNHAEFDGHQTRRCVQTCAHEIFTHFEDSTNGGGMQEGVR